MINLWLLPCLHLSIILSDHESLDAILHHHHHHHHHTYELYSASLAGMKVSVVANFNGIIIPPSTLPTPFISRLLIVYHNFGNTSSSYYTLSGCTLLTPVMGFLVYDFTSKNGSRIELNTNGKPMIHQMRKCAVFGDHKEVFLSEMRLGKVCYSRNQGHFSIVIPTKKKKKRVCWIIVGLVGVIIIVGVMGVRSLMCKRNEEMEKELADLQGCWTEKCQELKL